jgi:hypothetical protein
LQEKRKKAAYSLTLIPAQHDNVFQVSKFGNTSITNEVFDMKTVRLMVLIFLMIAGAAMEFPALAQQTNASTRVRIFTPFNPVGLNPGLTVKERINGSCMAGSLADASRTDAWRCNVGNQFYDPCFENSFGDRGLLACVLMPWTGDVTMLRPISPLPAAENDKGEPGEILPWALELANGQRCILLTGATGAVAGMRINYECSDGFYVAGPIDRTLPLWRVFHQPASGSIALDQMEVSTAWY